MLTQFRKFREQKAKEAAKEAGTAAAPPQRKRGQAEFICGGIGTWANKIGDLEFPTLSAEDRTWLATIPLTHQILPRKLALPQSKLLSISINIEETTGSNAYGTKCGYH